MTKACDYIEHCGNSKDLHEKEFIKFFDAMGPATKEACLQSIEKKLLIYRDHFSNLK